jgi:hypothetical protein
MGTRRVGKPRSFASNIVKRNLAIGHPGEPSFHTSDSATLEKCRVSMTMPRIVTVLQRPGVFAAFLVVCGSVRLLPVIWGLVFWPYYGQTGAIAVNRPLHSLRIGTHKVSHSPRAEPTCPRSHLDHSARHRTTRSSDAPRLSTFRYPSETCGPMSAE